MLQSNNLGDIHRGPGPNQVLQHLLLLALETARPLLKVKTVQYSYVCESTTCECGSDNGTVPYRTCLPRRNKQVYQLRINGPRTVLPDRMTPRHASSPPGNVPVVAASRV